MFRGPQNPGPDSFTLGAGLLRQLQSLAIGQAFDVTVDRLLDIEVPADPLDRQTPAFLAEWFRSRLPFHCTVTEIRDPPKWTFCRPLDTLAKSGQKPSTSPMPSIGGRFSGLDIEP